MFKRAKRILPIMSIVTMIGLSSVNANALTQTPQSVPKNVQAQSEDNSLKPLGYTIDEINQMSLAEYYQNCFPEVWINFSEEDKEQFKTINYGEFHSESNKSERKPIVDVFVSYATADSPATKTIKGKVGIMGDGSKKVYEMGYTYIIVDTTGATYGGGSGGDKNCTYSEMTYQARTLPSGRTGYVKGTFTLKPTSSSATQTVPDESRRVTIK